MWIYIVMNFGETTYVYFIWYISSQCNCIVLLQDNLKLLDALMKIKLLVAVITLLIIKSGYSQGIDHAKLNSYFQALEANNKFMGSVAVS